MNILLPLAIVAGLFLLGWLGTGQGMGWGFGVAIPYLAAVLFLGGLAWRILSWVKWAIGDWPVCSRNSSEKWLTERPA